MRFDSVSSFASSSPLDKICYYSCFLNCVIIFFSNFPFNFIFFIDFLSSVSSTTIRQSLSSPFPFVKIIRSVAFPFSSSLSFFFCVRRSFVLLAFHLMSHDFQVFFLSILCSAFIPFLHEFKYVCFVYFLPPNLLFRSFNSKFTDESDEQITPNQRCYLV